jgi:hypothetical protein
MPRNRIIGEIVQKLDYTADPRDAKIFA